MSHLYINWTKVYNVFHEKGHFNLYIASHKTGHFFGAILYYDVVREKSLSEAMTIPTMEFKHQNFFGNSEKETYDSAIKWIDDKLNGKYTVEERDFYDFDKTQ